MYMITKQVANAELSCCCLQEVRHRGTGSKIISLDTGEQYTFIWCGQKKRRDAGVGVLIKKCREITFDEPGEYEYQCEPHAGAGMKGVIHVQ